ncbi:MAG: sulfatase-like hydrolase/transferase, partial [Verrucomicrobiota bacterium]|nr:sulfatase-like hydrolase/transferase [Verrucomicrobiota bacterium]
MAAPALDAAKQTNFLFFLVDDMGWADIGANGSTFHETPNIDQLARSGMRFTH